MPTFRTLGSYADGTPGATDRLLYEDSTNQPRGCAPSGLTIPIASVTGLQSALDAKAPTANPIFTGTVTIPDAALAIADTSGLQAALDAKHAAVLADQQQTASFTFALTHAQKMTRCNHATVAITATVPTNATVAFPLGTTLSVVRWGAAAVTVAAAGGVTINKAASKTFALNEQYAVAQLWKQATDTWLLFGSLTDA
jgi:hypothetical protein